MRTWLTSAEAGKGGGEAQRCQGRADGGELGGRAQKSYPRRVTDQVHVRCISHLVSSASPNNDDWTFSHQLCTDDLLHAQPFAVTGLGLCSLATTNPRCHL